MKLGLFGINTGPCASPEGCVRVARSAEDAGLESVWTGEHVVLPDPQVPPSPVPPHFPMLDPAVALSFLAGQTRTIRLGTGIIILPQRNAVVLAKELASVDVLSGGRLVCGLGTGYLEAEFAAIGASFADRGARATESIEVLRALWTQEKPSFQGAFYAFSGIDARPRPVQKPHPPIVVGGHSAPAFRRAVAHGDGWYGFALDLAATERCLRGLADARKTVERPAGLRELEVSVTPAVPLDRDAVRRFEDLGVHRLVAFSPARTLDDALAFVEQIASLKP